MGRKIQYIGRYVMEGQTLGKGNFAKVELATHGISKCKVAIKIIDTRKIKEDYTRQNLYREARILAQIRHPNIIRLYETLKATTLYCLVTEYAAGGELLAYLKTYKDQRLSENQARPFVRQLISALHYLHERGVVHRDLKMENIMLDEKKKNIKLVDFGLSNTFSKEELLKTHCGSPEYAAPELFTSGKEYGSEIDIWSLGVIMYALVVGKLPFTTPYTDQYRRQKLLQQIQKGLIQKHDREMSLLSTDCRNLLRQLIEPNPELRLPLLEIEAHPWVTKNGKCTFQPYLSPPKDKQARAQIVDELATLLGLERKHVDKTVHEYRSDELSAMYNMLMDERKRVQGVFDVDHTLRPRRVAEKEPQPSRSPHSKAAHAAKKTVKQSPKNRTQVTNPEPSAKSRTESKNSGVAVDVLKSDMPQPILLSQEYSVNNLKAGGKSRKDNNPVGGNRTTVEAQVTVAQVKAILEKEGVLNSDSSQQFHSDNSQEKLSEATSSPAQTNPALASSLPPTSDNKKLKRPQRLSVNLELTVLRNQAQSSWSSYAQQPPSYLETSLAFAATNRPRVASPSKIPAPSPLREKTINYIAYRPMYHTSTLENRRPPKATPQRLHNSKIPSPINPVQSPQSQYNNYTLRTSRLLELARARGAIPKNLDFMNAPRAMPEDSSSSSDPNLEDYTMQQQSSMPDVRVAGDTNKRVKEISDAEPSTSATHLKSSEYILNSDVDTSEHETTDSRPKKLVNKYESLEPGYMESSSDMSQQGSGVFSSSASKSRSGLFKPVSGILSALYSKLDSSSHSRLSGSEDGATSNNSSTSKLVEQNPNATPSKQKKKFLLHLNRKAHKTSTPKHNSGKSSSKRASPHSPHGNTHWLPKPESPRLPMQMPIATIESFTDDEDDEFLSNKPLIQTAQLPSPTTQIPRPQRRSSGKRSQSLAEGDSSPTAKAWFPRNGIFTPVPDNSLRCELLNVGSSDSLTHESSVSSLRQDGSMDKLVSGGSGSKVHPVNIAKDDEQPSSAPNLNTNPSTKNGQSRIPRPSSGNVAIANTHSFTAIPIGPEGSNGLRSPQKQKKEPPPKLQLKDFDKEAKQSSWKTGLSHLLRRTKQSSMNNNVVTKQNASSSHNKLVKSRPKLGKVRKEWNNDMDAKWTTPPASSTSCVNSNSKFRPGLGVHAGDQCQ
ncbi:serine/threonine-protein kinase MARK1-like isoform X2 [Lineus longissimus]|uniref:serine/threonine-protein kinase MARK1-like isoform X2 n=1 Tax=Lineus longissimus TaxID=88925 RepID=UPI002B4DF91E